jgi:hypothetical protein
MHECLKLSDTGEQIAANCQLLQEWQTTNRRLDVYGVWQKQNPLQVLK